MENEACMFYASNFSIGMNIFFEINQKLSKLLEPYTEYNVEMEETHHTEKLDAPSGTAVTLAQQIIENNPKYNTWELSTKPSSDSIIPIQAHRIENITGTHQISWNSDIDDITICHKAHNRRGFAIGAVLAGEFIFGKTGVYSMKTY